MILVGAILTSLSAAFDIETVPVGNAGNAAELSGASAGGQGEDRECGAVGYEYRIGIYEVTAGEYTTFLNAAAQTDTYGLYDTNMWLETYGCKIQRDGSPGSYTYDVASGYADRPVNFVDWGDAARFANWLHNGTPGLADIPVPQDENSTEDGAYYLNGNTSDSALMAVTRESDWQWAIPSEDEWYKAAHHKNDGVTGNYFDYPTSSDSVDTSMANYGGSVQHTTESGAYPYPSPYDTFDQGGNVWEWHEGIIHGGRGVRGSSWGDSAFSMHAAYRDAYAQPTVDSNMFGFRVVQIPEPIMCLLIGVGGLLLSRRSRK